VRRTHLYGEQEIMDRFCEGMRKAAVPEEKG
jgi:hypothetical protein